MNGIRTSTSASVVGLMAAGLIGTIALGAPAQATPTQPTTAARTAPIAPAQSSVAKVVARADIDGDNKLDVVSVRPVKARGTKNSSWLVRVDTATKKVSQSVWTIAGVWPKLDPVFGIAHLDGVRGAEIVLRDMPVPHTNWYTVMSWRSGRLQRPFNPEERSAAWPTENSATASVGYTFATKNGKRTMTAFKAFGEPNATKLTGSLNTYRWAPKGWSRVSSKKVSYAYNDPRLTTYAGWNGSTLPKGL